MLIFASGQENISLAVNIKTDYVVGLCYISFLGVIIVTDKRREAMESLKEELTELNELSEKLAADSAELNQNLAAKNFVSDDLIRRVTENLTRWDSAYKRCRADYTGFGERDFPANLHDLSAEIQEQEKKELFERQAKAFLSLSAVGKTSTANLKKAQSKLKQALKKDITDAEMTAYTDFMSAVTATDSSQAISYVPALLAYFDPKFVADAIIDRCIVYEQADAEDVATAKNAPAGAAQENDEPAPLFAADDTEAPPTEAEIVAPTVDYAALVTEKGFVLATDESYGDFTYSHSPRETKEFKPTKFLNDVLNVSPYAKEKKLFLRFTSVLGSMSPELMNALTEEDEETWQFTAEFLYNKGYLRRYNFAGMGEFYGTSPRFGHIFAARLSADAVGMPRQRKRTDGDWLEPRASFAIPRLTYLAILNILLGERLEARPIHTSAHMAKASLERAKAFLPGLPYMSTDCFFYHRTEREQQDLIIGVFWTTTESADKFLRDFVETWPKLTPIKRVIIATLDKEQGKRAYDVLLAATDGELAERGDELYFFTISDYNFYAGLEQEKILPTDIWGGDASNDDEDDDDEEFDVDDLDLEDLKRMDQPSLKKVVNKVFSTVAEMMASAEKGEDPRAVLEEKIKGKKSASPVKTLPSAAAEADSSAQDAEETAPVLAIGTLASAVTREFSPEVKSEAVSLAADMVAGNKIYCATAYLKACALTYPAMQDTYLRLAYAVNDPLAKCSYLSDKVYEIFSTLDEPVEEYYLAAAALRSFLFDNAGFDYGLPMLHDALKQVSIVEDCAPLSDLIYMLMDFKRTTHKGADHYADYRVKNRLQLERQMENIRREAQDAYSNFIEGNIKEKAKQRRFIETKKLLFDRENYLATFLTAVINNDGESLELARTYLNDTFMRDDSLLDKTNIDPAKMDQLIDEAWADAGTRILRVKKNMDLMGSLRSNLANAVAKMADIICQWVNCADALAGEIDDDGRQQFKKIVGKLTTNTEQALDEMMSRKKSAAATSDRAGLDIVIKTLAELLERLQGTYTAERRRYFYVDFLRGPYVLLNDDYQPEFNRLFDADSQVSVMELIKAHAAADLMSFEDRIRYAFEGGGDDFRSAQMIDACLRERHGKSIIEAEGYDVRMSIEYARTDIVKVKDDFIENLELAQSYGQIDNLQENKKEKILQIINQWYEYAYNSTDFGVFKRVKEYWEAKIRADAKAREEQLRQEIEACRENMGHIENFDARMAHIEQILAQQNYTVAEDMLHRLSVGEPEMDAPLFEEDSLADFLDNYEFYYAKVSKNAYSLNKLLGNRQRNKDERGGARLADNWIVSGGRTGAAKIETLLNTLGFAGDKVTEQNSGKVEGYAVTLKKPLNGQKVNYKHPIAAFGSIAETAGFRVICLLGKYDADGLIERFKELGSAKATIVLLDYSMPLSDRRRLAKKVRSEMFEKAIGVIDRVLLMYLINHYNEMRVSQMLMSLMMPFAYYQPYIWESSKVMPPEIFMGRKEELSKIESAEGVNIVYGGRQLGKSAMLKMAKNDVDKNENNDRAILVDIKDKNCAEAALKVCHALNDEGFFTEETETDNWDKLARAIKKRLTSDSAPYIPYFLLLMDEADTFIASCAEENYYPFDALKDIQSIGVGRFKFVIAGLRNIIRFNREAALGNNNVITQLASMTVKPFRVQDARELLEVPLYYLGLRFPKGKESLISLILASTNYFPGLIQLYCAKLIEAMSKSDYAGYNQGETPIYEIREDHIKKVLADPGFTEQIKEKFEITLKLGDDQYYYIIALLMAYLYHENGTGGASDGYTADDLIAKAENLEIEQFYELPRETVTALMEDLTELNILRTTTADKYLFMRYAFFQMMGNQDEVEEKLLSVMEEGA